MESFNSALLIPNEDQLKEIYSEMIVQYEHEEDGDSFFFCNLADVVAKYQRWSRNLPRVKPFYAVKCNPDRVVLNLLAVLGCGFDCASKAEIANVLALGVSPDEIIYSHPCKGPSHIKFASAKHVHRMAFDNELELGKIKQISPEAQLILRIHCDDSRSTVKQGNKFGCDPQMAHRLLQIAKELGLNVVGVSFHVGSGCYDASVYGKAIEAVHAVFQNGAELGFHLTVVDIGGGFPGTENVELKFEDIASVINQALDKFFPAESNVEIIAEPGRFMVASAFTIAVNVSAKTQVPENANSIRFMYYLSLGVYSGFFKMAQVIPVPLLLKKPDKEELHRCTLWGPACTVTDCIMECCQLPELEIGDWLLFPNTGAYSASLSTNFNGITMGKSYYVFDESYW